MKDYKQTARTISLRNAFIITYTLLAVVFFAGTCIYFIVSRNRLLLAQSENYTTVSARQSSNNIRNFCRSAEMGARLIYDEPDLVSFYPKQEIMTAEEINTVQQLSNIMNKSSYIFDFADFGVIYSSGAVAGNVTDGTRALFGQNVFGRAVLLLGQKSESWTAFFSGNLSRVCFLKKLNDNAVFISSFYATKIGNVFNSMAENTNVAICVTDSTDRVIYGSDNMTVSAGDRLPGDILSRFDGKVNVTVGDDEGAACVIELDNGWRVYSIISPVRLGRGPSLNAESFILIMGLTLLMTFVIAGAIISAVFLSDGSAKRILGKELDTSTGVLTPFYCEERVSELIETSLLGGTWAFTLVKIKDYEIIKERLGSDFTEGGLRMLSDILHEGFGDDAAIGLNSRNEFVVFSDFSDYDIFKAHDALKSKHEEIRARFAELLVGENSDFKLDTAMGVCIYPDHGKDYDELDYKASLALSSALELDNDSLVFFDEKLERKQGGDS